jgi:hypothetical protein
VAVVPCVDLEEEVEEQAVPVRCRDVEEAENRSARDWRMTHQERNQASLFGWGMVW